MTFANPIAWGILLLAIPIIICFLYKVRFRTEPVTTLFLWAQVIEKRRFLSIRPRFRYFLSLFCALLFLAILTAAVLDPALNSPLSPSGSEKLPIDNLAITKFQPRRLPEQIADYELLIQAVNFGTENIRTRLEIELNDKIIDVIPLSFPPNQPVTKIVQSVSAPGGKLRAVLPREDKFPEDNTAEAVLPEQFVQRIFLFGTGNYFLRQVLQAQPLTEIIPADTVPADAVPEILPPDSVLVCYRTVPEILPLGNVLAIDPQNDCNRFRVGEYLNKPAASDYGQMYVVSAEKQQRTLVLAADLSQGTFPLQTEFPILISQALNFFRQSKKQCKDLRQTKAIADTAKTDNVSVKNDVPIWYYFAVFALCFTAAEWVLYQRRWIE